MTENIASLELKSRRTEMEDRRRQREAMLRIAVTGEAVSLAALAQMRGMVIEERENSIFSDAWIPLAVLFFIVGMATGRSVTVIALSVVLLLIVLVSWLWKNLSLFGVTYERHFDRTRVFPGEPIVMTVKINNHKPLPLTWIQFRDNLPTAVEDTQYLALAMSEVMGQYSWQNTLSLAGYEQVERRAVLRFAKRGIYHIGPLDYESGDIFTLFTIGRKHRYIDRLVIYPQIYPLAELGLPAKEPFGEFKVERSLFTDPIKTQGIRDYQRGDRFRDIHWKATAVRGNLQTKVYDPSIGMTISIFLNVATFANFWMGFLPEKLERAVSVAASIANYGVQQGWGVGVYANGSLPDSDQPIRVPPGRSPNQLSRILEALAAVTEFGISSIEKMMLRESTRLPWASTVILVTVVVTEEIIIGLLRLKEAGRRVVLISLANEPPPKGLGHILAYHIPVSVPAFQKDIKYSTATAAALGSIPSPKAVELAFEREETS